MDPLLALLKTTVFHGTVLWQKAIVFEMMHGVLQATSAILYVSL